MQALEKSKKQQVSVPKEIMQAMKLYNSKETVYSVSEKHTVMLLFLRQSLCCFAIEMIHDVYELLPELAKLNTVPIFVHQEPSEVVVKRLNVGFKISNFIVRKIKLQTLLRVKIPQGKHFMKPLECLELRVWEPWLLLVLDVQHITILEVT